MRERIRTIILLSALLLMIGAIFLVGKPQPSSAQNAPFKSYQLRVFCGNSAIPTEAFWHDVGEDSMGVNVRCAGNCPGGNVPLADALAGLPAAVSAALKAMVEKHQENAAAGKGWRLTCLGGKEPPERKCEKPSNPSNQPPWFDPLVSCSTGNPQTGSISWGITRRSGFSYTISICGEIIRYTKATLDYDFGTGPLANTGVRTFQICCSSWREAANSGSPCDALNDVDCDGDLNQSDPSPLSAPQRYARSDDYVSNSPLTNLPFWKGIFGPSSDDVVCKDCKWELTGVRYTCKNEVWASGRRERIDAVYSFDATWQCPSSGRTTQTKGTERKNGLRCPSRSAGRTLSWP